MKNSIKIFVIGALIIIIGAFLKIQKQEYSKIILAVGVVLEISSVVVYFINKKNKSAK
ncbi:GldL-related protein [Flavobacterium sp. RS13.1]|uniref:GldL-related protein n=1 Tax=Flavobacterium sp. RS13.1 TaxID=3400345 RepID=UPI003AAF1002